MNTFVALLRGINVSGKNALRMAELQASCAALGLKGVRTYLQSGNVVFAADRADQPRLAGALHARIGEDFGHDVEVLVLAAEQLAQVVRSNPLWPAAGGDGTLFHATFLAEPVRADRFRKLILPARTGEQAVLVGQTILLHCPHGYGRTKLHNAFFEKALGVSATTRNWRTVLALHALVGVAPP
jgi:uncharacterized protein (DUF1697 family)